MTDFSRCPSILQLFINIKSTSQTCLPTKCDIAEPLFLKVSVFGQTRCTKRVPCASMNHFNEEFFFECAFGSEKYADFGTMSDFQNFLKAERIVIELMQVIGYNDDGSEVVQCIGYYASNLFEYTKKDFVEKKIKLSQKQSFPINLPPAECILAVHSNILYGPGAKKLHDDVNIEGDITNPWTEYEPWHHGTFLDSLKKLESRSKRLSQTVASRGHKYKPTVKFCDKENEHRSTWKSQPPPADDFVYAFENEPAPKRLDYKSKIHSFNLIFSEALETKIPNFTSCKPLPVPKSPPVRKKKFYSIEQKYAPSIPCPAEKPENLYPHAMRKRKNKYHFSDAARNLFERHLGEFRNVVWSTCVRDENNLQTSEAQQYKLRQQLRKNELRDPERRTGALYNCWVNYLQNR